MFPMSPAAIGIAIAPITLSRASVFGVSFGFSIFVQRSIASEMRFSSFAVYSRPAA